MLATEETRPKPEPPTPGAYIAALAELSFLAIFAANRSTLGFMVWVVYFRFSALRMLLEELFTR